MNPKIIGAKMAVKNLINKDNAINNAEIIKSVVRLFWDQREYESSANDPRDIAGKPIMIAVERCMYHGRIKNKGKTNQVAFGLVTTPVNPAIAPILIAENNNTKSRAATGEFPVPRRTRANNRVNMGGWSLAISE